MSSSTCRIWLLNERDDDYHSLRRSDPKEYFAGVRREWDYRLEESERLRNDLIRMRARVPIRDSLAMFSVAGDTHNNKSFKTISPKLLQVKTKKLRAIEIATTSDEFY